MLREDYGYLEYTYLTLEGYLQARRQVPAS